MNGKKLIVTAGLAGILAFGMCGCSSSSTTTTEVETSVTDEEGTTTTTTTKTETTTEDGTSTSTETTTTDDSQIMDMSEWEAFWMGESTMGYQVFYAESPTGEEAFLVLYNEDKDDLLSYIGETENPEEGFVKVNGADQAFTFGIINVEGDYETLSLELGEECGQADITKCDAEEFVDAIHEFDTEHKLIR